MNDNLYILVEAQDVLIEALSILNRCPDVALYQIKETLKDIIGTDEPPQRMSLETMIRVVEDAQRD